MVGMNMRKQYVGYLLGADSDGSQTDRQLVHLGSKEFAGSRIDKNLPLAKLYQKCVDRCVDRSEEHTELQSLTNLVCRLLLEKKKKMPTAEHRRASPTSGKHDVHS